MPGTKPRILHLVGTFDHGGSERQAIQLIRMLKSSGYGCIQVACLDGRGPLRAEVESLGFPQIPEFNLTSFHDAHAVRQWFRFAQFLRQRKIGILHTHDLYTNIFGMIGGALARVPVRIASRRSLRPRRTSAQNLVERNILRLAHAIITNAEAIRRELVEREGVKPEKIATIYNGLDTRRIKPGAGFNAMAALHRFGLPQDPRMRLVTIIANMRHHVKDYPTFLRAACQVRKAVPDVAFALAGEGELTEQLSGLAAQLGLEHRAYFLGRCDNVAELLAISEVCVLSSISEGFSNSILEYMAAAKPAVVTDVGGAREAVDEGETGYIVPAGDHQGMAARIILLLQDPGRARTMGERARQVVESRFSCESQLQRTCSLYDHLLAGNRVNC